MLSKLAKYFYGCVICCLTIASANAQLGGYIVNVSFGEGQLNPGPALPAGNTSFRFTPDSCTAPGTYTITNNLYRCAATRMGRSIDNTPQSSYGYMMSIIDTASLNDRIIYVDTVREALCPGTGYRFAVAILNTMQPHACAAPHLPNFLLSIESNTGQVLQYVTTGPMNYDYDMEMTPKFHHYAADLIMPGGVQYLVIKLIDNQDFNKSCLYSFAIDDIQFAPLGPETKINFSDAVGTEVVRSVCFQDNKTINFTGSIGNFYTDTRLQWEQSTDNGVTWTDIPGATSLTYSHSFSVPDTFLFRLSGGEAAKMANPNCRVVSNVLRVEVDGIPTNLFATSNSPVCAGSQLKFNATGGASYEWHGPNGFYDNIATPNIFYSKLVDSGTYYADIITVGGCRATTSTYVKIIGIDLSAGPDTSICKGRSVRLHASAGTNYEWSPPDGLSSIVVNNPFAKPAATTTYTVKVTATDGCSDTAQVTINIINKNEVKAIIEGSEHLCRPYDSAGFKGKSTGDIITWSWNFDNGTTVDTSIAPVQYYSIPANKESYMVTLAIADSAGCTDTARHLLKVEDNCYIAVPTAFTPNGDGLNDYLSPLNAYKATDLLFRVFNRNGQIVFETREWTRKWDGTVRGIPQATGVYVWMLDYFDAAHKKVSLKGTATLIR